MDISIHAPRVGGDREHPLGVPLPDISIHAPRVGGDQIYTGSGRGTEKFQSTPPVWGATSPHTVFSAPM